MVVKKCGRRCEYLWAYHQPTQQLQSYYKSCIALSFGYIREVPALLHLLTLLKVSGQHRILPSLK